MFQLNKYFDSNWKKTIKLNTEKGEQMEKGICCICGCYKNLTYEHIPPRGSGNSKNVKSYKINYINVDDEDTLLENLNKPTFDDLTEGKKFEQYQRGYGLYRTCEDCNNSIKAVYDKEYIKLTKWVLTLTKNDSELKPECPKSVIIQYPHEFIPLYFVKSVIAMFGILYGESFFQKYCDLRDFVMDFDSLAFDTKRYKLYMYFLKNSIIYKSEPITTGNVSTIEGLEQFLRIINNEIKPPLTFEFAAYPFGFVLDIDNTTCRKELFDMSQWITSNEYADGKFSLNVFKRNSPITNEF